MDYSMFKEIILEGLKERYPDYSLEYKSVLKNNGIYLDGILIKEENSHISPTVYVNDYYDSFVAGRDIEDILDSIVDIIDSNSIEEDYDVNELMDFEKVREKIVYKIINLEKNKELLKTVPYREFLDLAVVYYIAVNEGKFSNASILINNAHLKTWGIDKKELEKLASINSPIIKKAEVTTMKETLISLMDNKIPLEECDEMFDSPMYVITNEDKQFGASVILYDNILKELSGKLQSDFYIIPSSIHELIAVPVAFVESEELLDEMIVEVNATQVPEVDILSGHSYYYSKAKSCVSFNKTQQEVV